MKTITTSQLRDPDVLAEAALGPIAVFDGKRSTEMVLGPKSLWEADQSLRACSMLLANAVVELPDDKPSPTALGPLGFAASWNVSDRLWLLNQLAEAYAESVRLNSPDPVDAFVAFVGRTGEGQPSRLAAPVAHDELPSALRQKLVARHP